MMFNLTKTIKSASWLGRSFSSKNIFPSISISANSITPQGPFAEVQAQFLRPDSESVSELSKLVSRKEMGIVAHFVSALLAMHLMAIYRYSYFVVFN